MFDLKQFVTEPAPGEEFSAPVTAFFDKRVLLPMASLPGLVQSETARPCRSRFVEQLEATSWQQFASSCGTATRWLPSRFECKTR